MIFSSLIFVFLFLPLVLAGYFVIKNRVYRNILLVIASLFFYTWGESSLLWVLLVSIMVNYICALVIEAKQGTIWAKVIFGLGVLINLSFLAFFKYGAFITKNFNFALYFVHIAPVAVPKISLPVGISFFTFHCLSYITDVFRQTVRAQKNLLKMALYISLFPQLIAGPIVRYHEIYKQLDQRDSKLSQFAEGVRRFVIGLGKKMLVANTVAVVADQIFSAPVNQLSSITCWLGALAYTLQIYYDFSGYSDMAIGLGLMLGFRFPENFNFPYIAQSIREFWRRWHMSLSNWFRDYLYIPLGGNRMGAARTCFNLLLVFLLCGLWHGASWTFLIWGIYHGIFLGLERLGLERLINKLWQPLRHLYVMLVVIVGWVFFRANNLSHACGFLHSMFFGANNSMAAKEYHPSLYLTNQIVVCLVFGIISAAPFFKRLIWQPSRGNFSSWSVFLNRQVLPVTRTACVLFVLFLSICSLCSDTYSPFIYFRF